MLNWNHRLFSEIFAAAADAFRNGHPHYVDRALPGPDNVAQLPELVERGRTRLIAGFAMTNERTGGQPFLAGNTSPLRTLTCWQPSISQSGVRGCRQTSR